MQIQQYDISHRIHNRRVMYTQPIVRPVPSINQVKRLGEENTPNTVYKKNQCQTIQTTPRLKVIEVVITVILALIG